MKRGESLRSCRGQGGLSSAKDNKITKDKASRSLKGGKADGREEGNYPFEGGDEKNRSILKYIGTGV